MKPRCERAGGCHICLCLRCRCLVALCALGRCQNLPHSRAHSPGPALERTESSISSLSQPLTSETLADLHWTLTRCTGSLGSMWRWRRSAGDPDAAPSGLPEGQHVEDTSFTQSYTAADFARDQEEAQRNALAEAGVTAESRDAPGQPAEEQQLGWCSANGLFAGLSGGALGAVYGLGEYQTLMSENGSYRSVAAHLRTGKLAVGGWRRSPMMEGSARRKSISRATYVVLMQAPS